MSSLRVLIYEDQPQAAENWADNIGKAYSDVKVDTANRESFQNLLRLVNSRRASWRDLGDESGMIPTHDVDSADVIVVDYDLLEYSDTGDTTGSRFAYLLRCFSGCGFIIILNEFGPNTFDLSLGSPSGDFADVHIGAEQIGNPGLWNAHTNGYRPWYWPVVPKATKDFEQCVVDVTDNFNSPILEFLGMENLNQSQGEMRRKMG